MQNPEVMSYDVSSKFRPAYLLKQAAICIVIISVITFCVKLAFKNGQADPRNVLLWFAGFAAVALIVFILRFLLGGLRIVRVSRHGITVKYLVTGKVRVILYDQIHLINHTSAGKTKNSGFVGYSFQTCIEFSEDEFFIFTDDEFENYAQIRNCILMYVKQSSS